MGSYTILGGVAGVVAPGRARAGVTTPVSIGGRPERSL